MNSQLKINTKLHSIGSKYGILNTLLENPKLKQQNLITFILKHNMFILQHFLQQFY